MSEKIPVMVRLPGEIHYKLIAQAAKLSIPPAVLARSLIALALADSMPFEPEPKNQSKSEAPRPANKQGTRAERRAKKRAGGR
jgi:hypothetical protein